MERASFFSLGQVLPLSAVVHDVMPNLNIFVSFCRAQDYTDVVLLRRWFNGNAL
jgi:hypothetical protein